MGKADNMTEQGSNTVNPAVLHGTESHIVHSAIMDFDFEISIHRPPVASSEPGPVVYAGDASLNFGFGHAANVSATLLMGGEIPPVLTVGIGYPVGADMAYVVRRRFYDFSPTSDEWQLGVMNASSLLIGGEAKGGGAPLFFRFMSEELWPWITARYNVSNNRTYVGGSMGGLFGIYTLFNHHGFFTRYIIGSPWICWDHPLCFDYEASYAAMHDDLDAIVFLAAGGAEHVLRPTLLPGTTAIFSKADTEAHTVRMGELLASRHYPSLKLKTLIFPEETHFTMPFALRAYGLRYVFQAA
jgi:predicted alpha/beta superfamily hydrolase